MRISELIMLENLWGDGRGRVGPDFQRDLSTVYGTRGIDNKRFLSHSAF